MFAARSLARHSASMLVVSARQSAPSLWRLHRPNVLAHNAVPKRTYLSDMWPRWPERLVNYAMPSRDITIDVPIDPSVYLPHHFVALAAESFHDLGLSWMYALMTCTIASRLILLGPYMHVLKLSTMRMMLWPEMVVRLQRFADTKDTQERFFWTRAYRIFRLEHRALQIPPLFVYPVCVVVMLVSNVFAFRLLLQQNPSMRLEGALWFVDLAQRSIDVDPMLRIPLIAIVVNLANQILSYSLIDQHNVATRGLYAITTTILFVWSSVTPFMPVGMLVCYFMPSGLFMLGQMSISHILKKKGVTDAYMLRQHKEVRMAKAAADYWKANPLQLFEWQRLLNAAPVVEEQTSREQPQQQRQTKLENNKPPSASSKNSSPFGNKK